MKRIITCAWFIGVSILAARSAETTGSAQKLQNRIVQELTASALLSPQIKQQIKQVLLPQMFNPVFVAEVEEQNKKNVSLEEIMRIDKIWSAAKDELALQRMLTDNPCANELKRLVAEYPVIVEAFVMDNQGANVGQNNITADYWQGDEAKFFRAYNEGKGGIDIAHPAFDSSVKERVQQISLPIINPEEKVIGAVTFSLRVRN